MRAFGPSCFAAIVVRGPAVGKYTLLQPDSRDDDPSPAGTGLVPRCPRTQDAKRRTQLFTQGTRGYAGGQRHSDPATSQPTPADTSSSKYKQFSAKGVSRRSASEGNGFGTGMPREHRAHNKGHGFLSRDGRGHSSFMIPNSSFRRVGGVLAVVGPSILSRRERAAD